MCGLIGARGLTLDEHAALDSIAHRGPDAQGWWADGTTTLGHTRLAIRDVAAHADQPYVRGHVVLTYNGELWNDDQLRDEIGGEWATTSDTETVAAVIERWGVDGLAKLDGMWAVAWHDLRDRETYLARDLYGRVPLYYTTATDGGLFGVNVQWASERKALPYGLEASALPPGSYLATSTGSIAVYGDPEPACEDFTPGRVLRLLRQGVHERLRSDVPVCFLASGGLDSTLILALAADEIGAANMVAYTAVLNQDSLDLAAARRVCGDMGIELREVPVPYVTLDAVEQAVAAVETPMKAQVEIALAHLPLSAAIQADGFKVCLSGEAADELFGGYGNMAIAASRVDDDGYREIKHKAVRKMARGNFARVNKVMMAHGIEARLPFMQRSLVRLALDASKEQSPLGKKLLKAAAAGVVPDEIIKRPKLTFQGATGTAAAAGATIANPTKTYNQMARSLFGYLPHD